jgi:hypothetical protein
MLTHRKIAVGTWACVVLGWLVCLNDASGIEMRSSREGRTVVRAASDQESAPDANASRVQQSAAEEVVLEEDPMLFEGDGACEPACGRASCCPNPCGPPCNLFGGGFWVDLDFLLWWRDRRQFPALVTTQPNAGVVPGATVLFGGPVDEQARPGGRLEVGVWLDPCQRTAIGGRYLAVADATISPVWTSSDLAFIARPFSDVSTTPATPDAFPVVNASATPPTTGRIGVATGSEMQAADFFFNWVLRRSPCASFGFLAGYQYAHIDEDLLIDSFTQSSVGTAVQSIAVTDLFDANNEFHGGLFGFRGDYRYGRFGVELLARIAFGNMRQTINIAGSTTATDVNGGTSVRNSGLLAQASTNGGLHAQDEFSFMDEAGIRLAFYPVERLKLSVGYSLMHWSSVVRPGGEIDTLVDGRLLTASPPADATHPALVFDPTDYIVQGLNFGAEFRF